MKRCIYPVAVLSTAALLALPSRADDGSSGSFDFAGLTPPGKGGEFVEVNIKGNLLAMAARLAEKDAPEASELLRSVQSVRVNVMSLDDGNRESTEKRIGEIRRKLEGLGWERNVTVREEANDVAVFTKLRGAEAVEGVVVTVVDNHKEAILVNVVGDVRPEKLVQLGERLDIEPLKKLKEVMRKAESDDKPEKPVKHAKRAKREKQEEEQDDDDKK